MYLAITGYKAGHIFALSLPQQRVRFIWMQKVQVFSA